jgi:hypothetical protein
MTVMKPARWTVPGYTFHQQSGTWFSDVDDSGPYVNLGGGVMGLMGETAPTGNSSSAALEASRVVKAAPGTLYALTVYNNSGSAQFYQLHDATAEPSVGAVPAAILAKIAAGGSETVYFGRRGRAFTKGIVVTNSSTGATLTVGAADSYYDAQYL